MDTQVEIEEIYLLKKWWLLPLKLFSAYATLIVFLKQIVIYTNYNNKETNIYHKQTKVIRINKEMELITVSEKFKI